MGDKIKVELLSIARSRSMYNGDFIEGSTIYIYGQPTTGKWIPVEEVENNPEKYEIIDKNKQE